MHDIAEFLGAHEPFSGAEAADLDDLSRRVEVEFFAAGTRIMAQGAAPEDRIRVVRKGTVELVDSGRVIDLLTEGEMFGHPSMLSGLPAGFEVRAGEDALCYSIAAEDVLPLLARPEGLRFLGRSILTRPRPAPSGPDLDRFDVSGQPAAALMGEQPVMADPDTTVGAAARRMGEEGTSSVLVRLPDGEFGIVTDRDMRRGVVAEGRDGEAPLSAVMSAPARVVDPGISGAELMLVMLDHGVHHVPVVDEGGAVLGVVRHIDLLAAQTRTPFVLRRAISDATEGPDLTRVLDQLNESVVGLHRAGLDHPQVSAIITVVLDALTRRMIEIAIEEQGDPPADFAWLALGSIGRREAVPSSDVDSGIAWRDGRDVDPEGTLAYMKALGERVSDALRTTGWRLDAHGVTAAGAFACRSMQDWRRAIGDWLEDPEDNKRLIATSILLDDRVVFGPPELDPKRAFYEAERRTALERWMLRLALTAKPPTGFLRDFVVEHSGERRGTLDVKHGGLLPVVDIARYAGLKAGAGVTSTVERLRAAGQAGVIDEAHAGTLEEAYDLFTGLRLEHQVEQLERGEEPDDDLDPKRLTPLTRRYLREAFREVAAVQKAIGLELKRAF